LVWLLQLVVLLLMLLMLLLLLLGCCRRDESSLISHCWPLRRVTPQECAVHPLCVGRLLLPRGRDHFRNVEDAATCAVCDVALCDGGGDRGLSPLGCVVLLL
jgi:hypothetical protein